MAENQFNPFKKSEIYVKKDKYGMLVDIDLKENIDDLSDWEYWATEYVEDINTLKKNITNIKTIQVGEENNNEEENN